MDYSFETKVNILHEHTYCDSITSTQSQTVIGQPMIGHDIFHQVANSIVDKALALEPKLLKDFELYSVDVNNPAGFNYNGERLAMVAQDYIQAFSFDIFEGKKVLKASCNDIPTYHNISKLAYLLSFDVRTSFDLGKHQFDEEFLDNLLTNFLDRTMLTNLANELIDTRSSQIFTLFCYFYYSYQEHFPNSDERFFRNFQRYVRFSIDEIKLLESIDIESNLENCKTILANYLVEQVLFFGFVPEVRKQIKDDWRIYTFYLQSDAKHFTLKNDIINFYNNDTQSKTLKLFENEFLRASSMSWNTYLNGTRFFANIFDSIYLQDFDINQIKVSDGNLIIFTNTKLSLLESDIIKCNCCEASLKSKNIEDFVAITCLSEDTKVLREKYKAIVSNLSNQINILQNLNDGNETSQEFYQWHSDLLDVLNSEYHTLILSQNAIAISNQLVKYYGYCDI